MTTVAKVRGALMVLGGGAWIFQGINLLPGSFMTGDPRWAVRASLAKPFSHHGCPQGQRRRSVDLHLFSAVTARLALAVGSDAAAPAASVEHPV